MTDQFIAMPRERCQTVLPMSTCSSALLIIITAGGAAGWGLAVWLLSLLR